MCPTSVLLVLLRPRGHCYRCFCCLCCCCCCCCCCRRRRRRRCRKSVSAAVSDLWRLLPRLSWPPCASCARRLTSAKQTRLSFDRGLRRVARGREQVRHESVALYRSDDTGIGVPPRRYQRERVERGGGHRRASYGAILSYGTDHSMPRSARLAQAGGAAVWFRPWYGSDHAMFVPSG